MKVQIDVFGSFVSRDVMRYMEPDRHILNRCIGGVPISTLFDAPLHMDENQLEKINVSQYDKRMMMIQLNRNAPALLKKSDSSVLILDLASECMNRIVFQDENRTAVAYPDTMEKYIDTLFQDVSVPFQKVSPLTMDMKAVERSYRRFAQTIVKSEANPTGYLEDNIIVIEAYYAENYVGTNDGILHLHSAKYKAKEINAMLKKLYSLLYSCIPNCRVIKMPTFTHSTQNHIRGFGPLFYTEETYQYFADCVAVLCGISKKNSIDNLYREQCLENQLYTRLLKSTAIYNIESMKKQIKDLTEEVESLKRKIGGGGGDLNPEHVSVYNTLPEIALYGDSIVAGYGSKIPFVDVVAEKSGIRLLNFGIGSTGYLAKVDVASQHLVGKGEAKVGVMEPITNPNNNVESRIAADIGNIKTKYVGIMAGTNDIVKYSIDEIVASMERCITIIYNNKKIPIIISPIKRYSRDVAALVASMEKKCKEYGCPFINMLNIGLYPQNPVNNSEYYIDGLHLNSKGNVLVACKLIGELQKIVTDGL